MRVAWRLGVAAVAVIGAAIVVRAECRSLRLTHWKSAGASADPAACPEAKALYGDCRSCVVAECCAEVHGCYSRTECIDFNDCWLKCADGEGPPGPRAECPAACEKRHAGAVVVFHAWDDCARSRCGEVCPRDADDESEERR